ncbi:MAG: hypothetical protein ACRENG_36320 [bacterium]
MKKEAGLWIDHRKAVIVMVTGAGEEKKQIRSNLEKRVRYSGGSRSNGSQREPEDQRDRRFTDHLNKYYAEVIACIREAESILLFGPGEAKVELEKRLESEGLKGRIVAIETIDKMTDRQIAAKVRERFLK